MRPQRGDRAAPCRLRRGIDARVRRAGEPHLVLQAAVLAIGVGGARARASQARARARRRCAAARCCRRCAVSAGCSCAMREHEVLHGELDVDHAARVVLEVEERGAVRMAGGHLAPHLDDVGRERWHGRAACAGSRRAPLRTPRRSSRRRRRSARASAPGAPTSTPARAGSGETTRATTTIRPAAPSGRRRTSMS